MSLVAGGHTGTAGDQVLLYSSGLAIIAQVLQQASVPWPLGPRTE